MRSKKSEARRTPRLRYRASFVLPVIIFHFVFLICAAAQDGPEDAAPPPLKILSKEERDQLASQLDLKDRTKLAIQLMGRRLDAGERLAAGGDPAAMYTELGGFHALMDHIIEHLDKLDERRGKVLDSYKRLEMGLRGYVPRLENLRREVPLKYEHYVRKLLTYVRDTRARALEPMFSNTVVRGNEPKPKKDP
jgi:hypothetical protein